MSVFVCQRIAYISVCGRLRDRQLLKVLLLQPNRARIKRFNGALEGYFAAAESVVAASELKQWPINPKTHMHKDQKMLGSKTYGPTDL